MSSAATILPIASEQKCVPVACRDCGVYRLCVPLGLEAPDLRLLERVVKRRQIVRRGDLLFGSGRPCDAVYAIRAGSVKTYLTTEDGRVQITGLHLAGELLGLSAIDCKHYTCDAVALETTSVCVVSVDRLEEVAAAIPAIHYQMLRIMSHQIRHDEELMLLLGLRSAEARLAAFLLGLSQRFAKRRLSATHLNLRMSRGEIGNYLGIAEETVCRLFSRFQKQGLIAVRRREVELLDFGCLRDVASERPAAAVLRSGAVKARAVTLVRA